MKKLIAVILVLALCLTFAACSNKGKSLEQIQSANKLVVATSPDFPPFEYLEGDKVVGIEVEIFELIAKELGVPVKYAGVGEGIEDLKPFDAADFAQALI